MGKHPFGRAAAILITACGAAPALASKPPASPPLGGEELTKIQKSFQAIFK